MIDLSKEKGNYVKLTTSGIELKADIELKGPFYITKDGAWQIDDIKIKVETKGGLKLDGTAKVKAPRAVNGEQQLIQGNKSDEYDLILKITPATETTSELLEFSLKVKPASPDDESGGIRFSMLGMDFRITELSLVTDSPNVDRDGDGNEKNDGWDPELKLKGGATLPKFVAVTTDGKPIALRFGLNADSPGGLTINTAGVSVSDGEILLPKEATFNLFGKLVVKTSNVSVKFLYTEAKKEASLTGKIILPGLGDLELDISGKDENKQPRQVTIREGAGGKIEYAANLLLKKEMLPIYPLKDPSIFLKNIEVKLEKAFDKTTVDVNAKAELHADDDKVGVTIVFKDGLTESIKLEKEDGVTLGLFGVRLTITTVTFLPDRDKSKGNEDFWEPELQLQGTLRLPEKFGKLVGGGEITATVSGDNYFIINEKSSRLTGGSIEFGHLHFKMLKVLEVEAVSAKLEFITRETLPDQFDSIFRVTGKYNFKIWKVEAEFDLTENKDKPDESNYITISRQGGVTLVDMKGKITVKELNLIPGAWGLKQFTLIIDTKKEILGGSLTITIPSGKELEGTLVFKDGLLNEIGVKASKLNYPIGTTGAFLEEIGMGLKNLSDGTKPLELEGEATLTLGPAVTVPLPDFLGGEYRGTALAVKLKGKISLEEISGSVTAVVVGSAETFVGLGQGELFFKMNWKTGEITLNGRLALLGGIITETGLLTLKGRSDYLAIFGRVEASIRLPEVSGLGPLSGKALGSGTALMKFISRGGSVSGFVAGWATINLPEYDIPFYGPVGGPTTVGLKIYFDGTETEYLNAEAIAALPGSAASLASLVSRPAAVNGTQGAFFAPGNSRYLLLSAHWTNAANNVPLIVEAPDGRRIAEADFAANKIGVVADLSDPNRKTVMVAGPTEGVWRLIVPNAAALGAVDFSAVRDNPLPRPTTTVTGPAGVVGGASIPITFNAQAPGTNAKVSLYYDTNGDGYDGVLMVDDLAEQDGPGTYLWDTSELSAGDYFVYSVIEADGQVPVFSNYSTGRVQIGGRQNVALNGAVYNDANGSGVRDPGEVGLAAVTVFLDADGNGLRGANETFTQTDAQGVYQFLVDAGRLYTLRTELPTGSLLIAPDPAGLGGYSISAEVPGTLANLDFGIFRPITISGVVFDDLNNNRARDIGEPSRAGAGVFVDLDGDLILDTNEPSITTGAGGDFSFDGIGPGTISVVLAGTTNPSQNRVIISTVSGQNISGVTLGVAPVGSVSGTVYRDENGNGVFEAKEQGLAGIRVFIDLNANGLLELGDPTAVTDGQGRYKIAGVNLGTYQVRQSVSGGLSDLASGATNSLTAQITTANLNVTGMNFGNRPPGLHNGGFDQADGNAPGFVWSTAGNAKVLNGQAALGASGEFFGKFEQTFIVPENAKALRFTITGLNLASSRSSLADALEVRLLDAVSGTALHTPAGLLSEGDAALNIQGDKITYFSSMVSLAGVPGSGQVANLNLPTVVQMDLSAVEPGSIVTISFQLLSVTIGSSATIDNVQLITGPALDFVLTEVSDSGVKGDGLTNISQVTLIGTTSPQQQVLLDRDGDGFDDGSALTDSEGKFSFANVPLIAGENRIRAQVTNAEGTSIVERVIALDPIQPTIVGTVINGGDVQRSMVNSVTITFSEDVSASLKADHLVIQNLTSGIDVLAEEMVLSYDKSANRATWTFPALRGGSLGDGNYRATLRTDEITDAASNFMKVVPNDPQQGSIVDFFRYYGDLDGDRDVDALDLFSYSRAYGKRNGEAGFLESLDIDGDGEVGSTELINYRTHYLTRLP